MSRQNGLTEIEAEFIRANFHFITSRELRDQLFVLTGIKRNASWLHRQALLLGLKQKTSEDRVVYDIQGPTIIQD